MQTTIRLSFVAAALIVSTAFASPAAAQNNSYARQARLANEARQYWWQSLSAREQYLVRAISAVEQQHQQRTGEGWIPVTEQNVLAVAGLIGARREELEFVYNRLVTLARNGEVLARTDRALEYMQNTPNYWMPEGMR